MISNNVSVFGAAVSNSRKLSSTSQIKRVSLLKHLSDILTLQTYVPIRGSSLKMITEYVVYLL